MNGSRTQSGSDAYGTVKKARSARFVPEKRFQTAGICPSDGRTRRWRRTCFPAEEWSLPNGKRRTEIAAWRSPITDYSMSKQGTSAPPVCPVSRRPKRPERPARPGSAKNPDNILTCRLKRGMIKTTGTAGADRRSPDGGACAAGGVLSAFLRYPRRRETSALCGL